MANPRQRRKRSSNHRSVSHSKHAKRNLKKMPPIRAPKVIQQAWDKHKTVRQNYAALGLIHDLNPSESGGAEMIERDISSTVGSIPKSSVDSTFANSSSTVSGTSHTTRTDASGKNADAVNSGNFTLPRGHGRIIRDEAGNVLRIELPEEAPENDNFTVDADADMEQSAQLDASVRDTWISDLGGSKTRLSTNKNTPVVKGRCGVRWG
ncbi:hypothetical protein D9757_001782 [Collybiopsis confluens]|uniref:Nucleolar protein 16 n=1 Tax=Collybiopsis confluens TaxID=2823264 RepID=A0A8H5HYX9_9AGAR|nr:hypothetical protein D9757_001782 [Collybiopsis confluens]